jgi:hypothetical protein
MKTKFLMSVLTVLELVIVGGVFCILIPTAFILKMSWAKISNVQIVLLAIGTVGLLGLLLNAKGWMLKQAAKASIAITLTCLYITSRGCTECAVATFKMTVIIIGIVCIAAVLAQVPIAYLIKKENGQ